MVDLANVRCEDLLWDEGCAKGVSGPTLSFPGIAQLHDEMGYIISLIISKLHNELDDARCQCWRWVDQQ